MKKKFLIILPILTIFILGLLTVNVSATYRSNDPTVKSGETITITVKSTEALPNYDLSLKSYKGLTYVGCSAENAVVNSSTGKIAFVTLGAGATTLGTYTFKAPQVTSQTKYIVEFNVNGVTNKSTVTVNPKETTPPQTPDLEPKPEPTPEPEKGTVSSCYINGIKVKKDLPVTNKDSVSIKVNTSTNEGLTIYNDQTKKSYNVKSGATTNVQILEGTNTLTITLDSGYTTTRKIYSQKEEVVEPNVIEEPEEKIVVALKSLLIKGVNSEEEKIELSYTPEFSAEVFEYSVLLDETLSDITKLDIEAIATSEDFTVEITGNEELKDGENIITIIVKSKDGEKTATYTIKVTKEVKVVPTVAVPIVEVETEVIEPLWNPTQIILITIFTSIIAIMGIAYAVIEYRYTKENKEETKIPYSGINVENEEKVEEMPFAKIGFEKEVEDKKDILKEEKEPEAITKPKRGKHF